MDEISFLMLKLNEVNKLSTFQLKRSKVEIDLFKVKCVWFQDRSRLFTVPHSNEQLKYWPRLVPMVLNSLRRWVPQ